MSLSSDTPGWRRTALGLAAACGMLFAACGPKEPTPSPASNSAPSAGKPRQTLSAAQRAQHIAKTEAALKKQILLNPNDVKAHLALGNLYYDTNRPHLAVAEYQIVLKTAPCDPNVRTDLGTCYKHMNQWDKARAQYEQVIKKHPNHIMATFNLAVVLEHQGDLRHAAELWERAAFLNPDSHVATVALKYATSARKAAAKRKSANAKPGASTPRTSPTTPVAD